MNAEMISRSWKLKRGGDREKLRTKPAPEQVSVRESVTTVTDSERELPVFVEPGGVSPVSQV